MNRASYNQICGAWDAARSGFSGREADYLNLFLQAMPVSSSVLDLGCGTARPLGASVIGRGHRYVGVDQAEGMLALAAQRFPQSTWICARIEDFLAAEKFAGIVCWDALFHIDRTQHRQILSRMAGMLEAEGRLMLTVGGSEHPAFTDRMFGAEFFYDSFPPEAVREILHDLGFRLLLGEFMNLPDGGRDKGRYAIVAQRDCGDRSIQ